MEVHFHATLRDLVGERTVDVPVEPGQTIRDMINAVIERHPDLQSRFFDDDGSLVPYIHIFMDGRNVRLLEGLDTPITPEARISIFPPIAGG